MSTTTSDNMSSLKPITVYGQGGINPAKVSVILSELGVPYEEKVVPLADIKKPEYTAVNPNGRLPAIHDPNTGITLWESGAIVEYLIERYDAQEPRRLSFEPGTPEAAHARQWLHYQVSGQGPYYGQASWYKKFEPEPAMPRAIERYVKEVNRVTAVLEGWLARQEVAEGSDGPWLVGGKCSYADLAFLQWQKLIQLFLTEDEYVKADYPQVTSWLQRMASRPKTKAVVDKAGPLA